MCIAEPLSVLAAELGPVADRVSVILPWGDLLRVVATADVGSLCDLARLCLPAANLEIVFSYDRNRDAKDNVLFDVGTLDEQYVATLTSLYEQAGLRVVATEKIAQAHLAAYETTWAKRLAFGRPREVWRIRARRSLAPWWTWLGP